MSFAAQPVVNRQPQQQQQNKTRTKGRDADLSMVQPLPVTVTSQRIQALFYPEGAGPQKHRQHHYGGRDDRSASPGQRQRQHIIAPEGLNKSRESVIKAKNSNNRTRSVGHKAFSANGVPSDASGYGYDAYDDGDGIALRSLRGAREDALHTAEDGDDALAALEVLSHVAAIRSRLSKMAAGSNKSMIGGGSGGDGGLGSSPSSAAPLPLLSSSSGSSSSSSSSSWSATAVLASRYGLRNKRQHALVNSANTATEIVEAIDAADGGGGGGDRTGGRISPYHYPHQKKQPKASSLPLGPRDTFDPSRYAANLLRYSLPVNHDDDDHDDHDHDDGTISINMVDSETAAAGGADGECNGAAGRGGTDAVLEALVQEYGRNAFGGGAAVAGSSSGRMRFDPARSAEASSSPSAVAFSGVSTAEARQLLQYSLANRAPPQQRQQTVVPSPSTTATTTATTATTATTTTTAAIFGPVDGDNPNKHQQQHKVSFQRGATPTPPTLATPSLELALTAELLLEVQRQRRAIDHLATVQGDHLRRLAKAQAEESRRRLLAPRGPTGDPLADIFPELATAAAMGGGGGGGGGDTATRIPGGGGIGIPTTAQSRASPSSSSPPPPSMLTFTTGSVGGGGVGVAAVTAAQKEQKARQVIASVMEREARFYEAELTRLRGHLGATIDSVEDRRRLERDRFAQLLEQQQQSMLRAHAETLRVVQRETRLAAEVKAAAATAQLLARERRRGEARRDNKSNGPTLPRGKQQQQQKNKASPERRVVSPIALRTAARTSVTTGEKRQRKQQQQNLVAAEEKEVLLSGSPSPVRRPPLSLRAPTVPPHRTPADDDDEREKEEEEKEEVEEEPPSDSHGDGEDDEYDNVTPALHTEQQEGMEQQQYQQPTADDNDTAVVVTASEGMPTPTATAAQPGKATPTTTPPPPPAAVKEKGEGGLVAAKSIVQAVHAKAEAKASSPPRASKEETKEKAAAAVTTAAPPHHHDPLLPRRQSTAEDRAAARAAELGRRYGLMPCHRHRETVITENSRGGGSGQPQPKPKPKPKQQQQQPVAKTVYVSPYKVPAARGAASRLRGGSRGRGGGGGGDRGSNSLSPNSKQSTATTAPPLYSDTDNNNSAAAPQFLAQAVRALHPTHASSNAGGGGGGSTATATAGPPRMLSVDAVFALVAGVASGGTATIAGTPSVGRAMLLVTPNGNNGINTDAIDGGRGDGIARIGEPPMARTVRQLADDAFGGGLGGVASAGGVDAVRDDGGVDARHRTCGYFMLGEGMESDYAYDLRRRRRQQQQQQQQQRATKAPLTTGTTTTTTTTTVDGNINDATGIVFPPASEAELQTVPTSTRALVPLSPAVAARIGSAAVQTALDGALATSARLTVVAAVERELVSAALRQLVSRMATSSQQSTTMAMASSTVATTAAGDCSGAKRQEDPEWLRLLGLVLEDAVGERLRSDPAWRLALTLTDSRRPGDAHHASGTVTTTTDGDDGAPDRSGPRLVVAVPHSAEPAWVHEPQPTINNTSPTTNEKSGTPTITTNNKEESNTKDDDRSSHAVESANDHDSSTTAFSVNGSTVKLVVDVGPLWEQFQKQQQHGQGSYTVTSDNTHNDIYSRSHRFPLQTLLPAMGTEQLRAAVPEEDLRDVIVESVTISNHTAISNNSISNTEPPQPPQPTPSVPAALPPPPTATSMSTTTTTASLPLAVNTTTPPVIPAISAAVPDGQHTQHTQQQQRQQQRQQQGGVAATAITTASVAAASTDFLQDQLTRAESDRRFLISGQEDGQRTAMHSGWRWACDALLRVSPQMATAQNDGMADVNHNTNTNTASNRKAPQTPPAIGTATTATVSGAAPAVRDPVTRFIFQWLKGYGEREEAAAIASRQQRQGEEFIGALDAAAATAAGGATTTTVGNNGRAQHQHQRVYMGAAHAPSSVASATSSEAWGAAAEEEDSLSSSTTEVGGRRRGNSDSSSGSSGYLPVPGRFISRFLRGDQSLVPIARRALRPDEQQQQRGGVHSVFGGIDRRALAHNRPVLDASLAPSSATTRYTASGVNNDDREEDGFAHRATHQQRQYRHGRAPPTSPTYSSATTRLTTTTDRDGFRDGSSSNNGSDNDYSSRRFDWHRHGSVGGGVGVGFGVAPPPRVFINESQADGGRLHHHPGYPPTPQGPAPAPLSANPNSSNAMFNGPDVPHTLAPPVPQKQTWW